MWASTLCPLSSSTRKKALGKVSTTVPSISMAPSFLGMSSALHLRAWLVVSRQSAMVRPRNEGPQDGSTSRPIAGAESTAPGTQTRTGQHNANRACAIPRLGLLGYPTSEGHRPGQDDQDEPRDPADAPGEHA